VKAIKLTPWFDPSVVPGRTGLYQTKLVFSNGEIDVQKFSYWSGVMWSDSAPTREEAMRRAPVVGLQKKYWRGLAEQPK
jgi:hypothetical protein